MINNLLQHKIIKNLLSLATVQIINYIVPLLSWPLLANTLGVEQFGVVMMLLAICTIANILTDFGFNLSATHTIAQNIQNKQKIAQLLGNIFVIKSMLAIIACIISSIYIYFKFLINYQTNINIWTLGLVSLIIISQAYNCIWFFHGIEKMSYITKANVFAKIFYISLLSILLNLYTHINIALLCLLISQLWITYLFIWYIYKEKYFIASPKLDMLWQEVKYSFSFFISRLAVSVYTTANTLILGHFHGAVSSGLYSSAEKLYAAANGTTGIVSQAVYPYMIKHNNLKLLIQIAIGLEVILIVFTYILSLFSENLIVLLFGEDFRAANEYFKVFLIILCLSGISMLFGYPAFSVVKKVQWANYTVIVGALLYLVGLIVLFYANAITAINIVSLVLIIEAIVLFLRIVMVTLFYLRSKK
ncbi:oligosaccharide flippase family protein [Alysiella crassa]|uniref:O-antigen transporter n=1 Tax=Alysiella crassa TaxID=153491 RepID=A0A376BT25_9NEIS|nr:oligosaccharide flippase family protein [Alysiella crassa]SSY80080.1 Putative O-antigen transporter [Alysiella crassa]